MADTAHAPVETAKPDLSEQYNLDDSAFDAELDGDPTDFTPPAPKAPDAKPAPPKDPETGRFVARKHSPALVAKAAKLGVSQATLDEIAPEDLAAYLAVEAFERSHAAPKAESTVHVDSSPAIAGKEPAADALDLSGLDDGYDPTIRDLFKKMAAKIEALEQGHGQVNDYIRRQASEQATSQTDLGFEDLGDGAERLFGKGAGIALQGKPESQAAFKRRMAVVNSLRADPIKGVSIRQAVKQRAGELFGDLIADAPAAPPAPKDDAPKPRYTPDEWQQAGLPRPTHRNGSPEPKGEKKATKAVAAFLRERGNPADGYDRDDGDSSLPD